MGKLLSWWRKNTVTKEDREQMVILAIIASIMFPIVMFALLLVISTIIRYPLLSLVGGLTLAGCVWVIVSIDNWTRRGK